MWAISPPPIRPTKADLSLAISVSSRIVALGESVSITIVVNNTGGAAATTVVVLDTLRSLTLLRPSPGVVGSGYTIIQGTVTSLNAGETARLVFRAAATTTGFMTNAAQIWSSGTADPDSTPGSVTLAGNNLNGEDDTVRIDLRMRP